MRNALGVPGTESCACSQNVMMASDSGTWKQGCKMRLRCKQHYTGLSVQILGFDGRSNPAWMAHLPVSILLSLAAGFLTSNKAVRFGFGGVLGVTTLLAVFIIILIKLTPSQMKTATKLL